MTEGTLQAPAEVMVLPYARAPSRRTLWLVLIAAFLGWMLDGLEMGIFPLVATPIPPNR